MAVGIKDTMELLVFVEEGIKKATEASADGNISLKEALSAVPGLLPKAKDAFMGVQNIQSEIQDLDSAEISQVIDKCLSIVSLLIGIKF